MMAEWGLNQRAVAFSALRLGTALLWVGICRLLRLVLKSPEQVEWHHPTTWEMPQWLRLGIEARGELSLDEVLLLRECAQSRQSKPTHCKVGEAR